MFYYYGRKKQISRHYPKPNFDTIIEPFAGAAAYSLHADNWKRNVILIEKDLRVAEIWRWLIEEATPEDFEAMPNLQVGETSTNFLQILHSASKMAFKYKTIKVTSVLARNWEISKRVMARDIHKVKHWTLVCGEYSEAPDIEATWFIDPPYKGSAGLGYDQSSALLDYEKMALWATRRRGEVIACEGELGDYLPFTPLINLKGIAGKKSLEKIYYQTNTNIE